MSFQTNAFQTNAFQSSGAAAPASASATWVVAVPGVLQTGGAVAATAATAAWVLTSPPAVLVTATAEYEAWMADPVASATVLANVYPEEPLTGLAARGGASTGRASVAHYDYGAFAQASSLTLPLLEEVAVANRVVVVTLAITSTAWSPGASSVTLGGVALTLHAGHQITPPFIRCEVWKLVGSDTLPAGTELIVTFPDPAACVAGLTVLSNVDQTTPLGTAVLGLSLNSPPSVNVATSGASQLVMDAVAVLGGTGGSHSVDASQDDIYTTELTGVVRGGASVEAGTGGSVNMLWATVPDYWVSIGFTVNPGPSPIYQLALSELVLPDVFPGGFFAEIVGVVVDAAALVQQSTLFALESNPASWLYDLGTGLLMLHLAGGQNPAAADYVAAVRQVRVSTDPIEFDNRPLYYPWLSASGLPEIEDDAGVPLAAQFPVAGGTVAIDNAARIFDRLGRAWHWRNREVELLYGGGLMAYDEYQPLGRLLVADVTADDRALKLRLRIGDAADRALPTLQYQDLYSTTTGKDRLYVPGNYVPLLFGTVRDVPLVKVRQPTINAGYPEETLVPGIAEYLVGYAPGNFAPSISNVRARGSNGEEFALALGIDWSTATTMGGQIVVFGGWVDGGYTLVCDAVNDFVLPDWYDGGAGNRPMFVGSLVRAVLWEMGVSLDGVDVAAFELADQLLPMELGVYVPGDGPFPSTMALKLIAEVVAPLMCRVYKDNTGLWTIRVWDPGLDVAAATPLNEQDIEGWEPRLKLESVVKTVRVRYAPRVAAGSYDESVRTAPGAGYRNKTDDGINIPTHLAAASDAGVLADRHLLRLSQPTTVVVVSGRGKRLLPLLAGDKLQVTRGRAPSPTGSYNAHRFEVLRVRKRFAPTASVELTIGDLSGLAQNYKRWAEAALAGTAYGSATGEDQRALMFWADGAGLVAGGTEGTFRWW